MECLKLLKNSVKQAQKTQPYEKSPHPFISRNDFGLGADGSENLTRDKVRRNEPPLRSGCADGV